MHKADRLRWQIVDLVTAKRAFNETLNRFVGQFHLYGGLFICSFLLIFVISTIRMNHGWHQPPDETTTTVALPIQADVLADIMTDDMAPEERAVARQLLVDHIVTTLNLHGEIAGAGAGLVKRVEVNVRAQEATIMESRQGLFGTIRYLHLNPGPHRQPQWIGTKAWGWIVDTTVYVTLLLTLSGIYLWAFIREERKAGIVVLGAGAVSFVAILYALLIA